MLEEPSHDPEFHAAWVTLRTYRSQADPQTLATLTLAAAAATGTRTGPSRVLVERFAAFQWEVGPVGEVVDHLGEFPLLHDPTQSVYMRMRLAWNRQAGASVEHRPRLAGMSQVDASLTKTVLGKLPDTDQAILRLVLNGSFVANDKVHKYDPDQTEQCPLCQEPDSMHHRHWECAATQASRQAIPAGVGSLELLHECTRERGWAIISPQQIRWMKRLLEPVTFEYCAPHSEPGVPLNLFTDGSAQSPQDPVLRYAAWAVTAVHEHDIWENHIVAQGPVPDPSKPCLVRRPMQLSRPWKLHYGPTHQFKSGPTA